MKRKTLDQTTNMVAIVNDDRFEGGHDLTWERLVAAEPRLASLLDEVRVARPANGDEFELEGIWGRFKNRLADLVGWHRRDGDHVLNSDIAYRTVYHTLLRVLHGNDQ